MTTNDHYDRILGHPADDAAPRKFGGRKPMGDVAYRNRHGESW